MVDTLVNSASAQQKTPEVGPLQAMHACYVLQRYQQELISGKTHTEAESSAQSWAEHYVPGTQLSIVQVGYSMAAISYNPQTNQVEVSFSTLKETTNTAMAASPLGGGVNGVYAATLNNLKAADGQPFIDSVMSAVQGYAGTSATPVDVNVSGYSHGGTLATIAVGQWMAEGAMGEGSNMNLSTLYTFGSPPAGSAAFTQTLQNNAEQAGVTIQRVVAGTDITPNAFAADPRYTHLDSLLSINNQYIEVNPEQRTQQASSSSAAWHSLAGAYIPVTAMHTAMGATPDALPPFRAINARGKSYDVHEYRIPTSEPSPFGEPCAEHQSGGIRGLEAILGTIGNAGYTAETVDLGSNYVAGYNPRDYAMELIRGNELNLNAPDPTVPFIFETDLLTFNIENSFHPQLGAYSPYTGETTDSAVTNATVTTTPVTTISAANTYDTDGGITSDISLSSDFFAAASGITETLPATPVLDPSGPDNNQQPRYGQNGPPAL